MRREQRSIDVSHLLEAAGEELAFTKCNCDAIMASAAAGR